MTERNSPVRDEHLDELGTSIEELRGTEKSDVPEIPPGELCNCRKFTEGEFTGYCNCWAGKGCDTADGRCKNHGGLSPGAPKNNGNAQTHALTADPKMYHKRLDEEEKGWVYEMTEVICDRLRSQKGGLDPLDRTLARRVCIKLHIAAHASEYVADEGLFERVWTEDGQMEVPNRLLEELRRFDSEIVSELKSLGVLDDPDSQKADALSEWKAYVTHEG